MSGLVRRIAIVVALVALLGPLLGPLSQAAPIGGAQTGVARAETPTDSWLASLNAYRVGSGLQPVVDEPEWSAGIVDHLRYLAYTSDGLRSGSYASVHDENPLSPYYTDDGTTAARSSNLGTAASPAEAIDHWITAPFHAIGLLRPGLRRSAFGQLDNAVGLDVIRGVEAAPVQQVLFPGDGALVGVDSYQGREVPSPLEGCQSGGFDGLPIMALLTDTPSEQLTASLTTPGGTVLRDASDLCIVTEHTYRTTDQVYGTLGFNLLRDSNAVFLFPRDPLTPGSYAVSLEQPGRAGINWHFGVGSIAAQSAYVGPDAPLRVRAGEPGSAVFGTLTVDGPLAAGFMTLYPCAVGRPNASTLNFAAGQTIANSFVSTVDADGFVCVYSMAPAHVIVDVVGGTSVLDGLHSPTRLIDTRLSPQTGVGGRISSDTPLRVRAGQPGSTVFGTLTVDGPLAAGFVTLYPCAAGRPTASSLNFAAGQTIANSFVSVVDSDGFVCVYSMAPTHVIVDVVGETTVLGGVHSPTRLVDTRTNSIGRLGAGTSLRVRAGQPGSTVFGTLTVDGPLAAGFVTLYPCAAGRPTASSLNFAAGQTIANSFVSVVDSDGFVCVYSMAPTHVIVDVVGETTVLNGLHSPTRLIDTRISAAQRVFS